jgi:MFS family permease
MWKACTKEDVCANKVDFVRADHTDVEFLENWVPKLNLLCEKKDRLGLLGSAFFAGILFGMMILPQLADKYGRKKVFNATIFLSIVA